MRDSERSKPGPKADPKPESKANTKADANTGHGPGKAAGRIVHDERGNAVWDWIVETGRIFVGNTSRLLRRLEAPELKMEEPEPQLHLESDRDAAGGYDPYGRSTGSGRTTGGKIGANTGSRGSDSGAAKSSEGGGYDPYSSGGARKHRR
jgi:hypothetical protein